MFNYFTSEKKKQYSIQIQNVKDSEFKQYQRKLQKDKKLIKRYIERTTHGYQKMVDANLELKNYKEYRHQFRDFNKEKNIGPPSFYFRQRNDKQRVNIALKQNQDLDNVPFFAKANPSTHKFRQNKSQYDFKYTSYDTASRVIESVQQMKTNQVPTSWNFDVKSYLKTQRQSAHKNSRTSQRNAKKAILPTLNIKHHPKSLQSIKNKLIVGPLKNALLESKKFTNQKQSKIKIKARNPKNLSVKFCTFHVRNQQQNQM